MQAQILFDTASIKHYQTLTYKRFQHRLKNRITADDGLIPIGINLFGRPIAFLLAEQQPNSLYINSIFVEPEFRRQGLARQLIETLSDYGKQDKINKLKLSYVIDTANTAATEAFLSATNWSAPEPDRILCYIEGGQSVEELLKSRWMNMPFRLSSDYKIVMWSDISKADFERLQQQHAAQPFYKQDEGYTPDIDNFAKLNSLGLLYKNDIIGWMLTKHIKQGTILYDNMFIKQEHRKFGRIIALLSKAIKLQYQHGERLADQDSIAGLGQTEIKNTAMKHFIERYFTPYLKEIKFTQWVTKKIV